MSGDAVKVFFSYAHEDEVLRNELAKHLKILERNGVITSWHDRRILPGDEWDHQINSNLQTANIILLLVSPDFLASNYCWDVEITTAMARHESKEACVIPVILRQSIWSSAPFGKLQALPKNAAPVTDVKTWPTIDDAFANIAEGIRKAANEIRHQKVEKYRNEVRLFLDEVGGEISAFGRSFLDALSTNFGLAPEDAMTIENEELQKIRLKIDAIDRYSKALVNALQDENPLGEVIRRHLKRFQHLLQLSDEEVLEIEAIISDPDPPIIIPPTIDPPIINPPIVNPKELSECDSSRLLFLKNIRDPNGDWSYTLERIGKMNNSPESRIFELYWLLTSKGSNTPSQGDLMILNQRARVTHIVEMLDDEVRKTEAGYFRWVRIVWMPKQNDWIQLPHQRDVLGFEPPRFGGGATYSFNSPNFGKFHAAWNSLSDFQQHIFEVLKHY